MTNQKNSLHAICFDDICGKRKNALIRAIRKEQPEKMWLLFCLAD